MNGFHRITVCLSVLLLSLAFTAGAQKYLTVTPIHAYLENSRGDVVSTLENVILKIGIYTQESASQTPRITIDLQSTTSKEYLLCFQYSKGRSAYDYKITKTSWGETTRVLYLLSDRRKDRIMSMWVPYNYNSSGSLFLNIINLSTGKADKSYELELSPRDTEQVFKALAQAAVRMNFRKWTDKTRSLDVSFN